MSKGLMAKADFVTGLVLFAIGVLMIVAGTGMPGPEQISYIEAGGEPGRVPIMLGAILAVFAAILLIRAVGQGGHRLWRPETLDPDQRVGAARATITALGCSLYAVGLLGATWAGWKMPYELATGIFMFAFIVGFEWQDACEVGAARWAALGARWPGLAERLKGAFHAVPPARVPYAWLLVSALVQAIVITWAVTYLFEQEFFVTLP